MLLMNRFPRTAFAPFPSFARLPDDVSQLLNGALQDSTSFSRNAVLAMNIWETPQNFTIEAELPGFSLSDIDVTVHGDEVTIKGSRTLTDREGATCLRRERSGGSFERTWTLPTEIQAGKVEANLTNGVLTITLPKSEKAQPHKVAVRGA